MFERLRRDLHRHFLLDSKHGSPGFLEKLWIIANAPGIQALAVHRFGAWINGELAGKSVRCPLKAVYYILDKITVIMWGVHIDEGADIGGGLYMPHVGGILIGPVKMGRDCNVGPGVILGRRTDGRGRDAAPTLGDRVWIGAGSVVFGGITIGTGTSIGPLTVVARNLSAGCLVHGSPMQVIRREHDNASQIYGKNGPPRAAARPTNGDRASLSALGERTSRFSARLFAPRGPAPAPASHVGPSEASAVRGRFVRVRAWGGWRGRESA